jgi:hypothetical protein
VHHNKARQQEKKVYPQIAFADKAVKGAVPRRQCKTKNVNMEQNNQNSGQTTKGGKGRKIGFIFHINNQLYTTRLILYNAEVKE